MTASCRTPPKIGNNWRQAWKSYGVVVSRKAQLKALITRDGIPAYRCAMCQQITARLEVEHIYPLHLVDRTDYPACLRYWSLSNLELVCDGPECHKAKTAKEAKARAKADRAGKKHRGECKPKRKVPSRPLQKPTPDQSARIKASKAAWVERVKAERASRDNQSYHAQKENLA